MAHILQPLQVQIELNPKARQRDRQSGEKVQFTRLFRQDQNQEISQTGSKPGDQSKQGKKTQESKTHKPIWQGTGESGQE